MAIDLEKYKIKTDAPKIDLSKYKLAQPVQQPEKKGDFLGKTGKVLGTIFGGEKIGEAIGTQLAKKGIVGGLTPNQRQYVGKGPSFKEVAGDVAGIGLTLGGLKGVSLAGSFGTRLIKSIGLSAGLSGAQAIKTDKGVKDITKSAVLGGTIGAGLPVAGAGLRAIGNQVKLLPARFINSALGRSKAQVLQDISKDKVDDFAKYVLKTKPVGTANKLLDKSEIQLNKLNTQINTSLTSALRKTGEKTTIGINNFLDQIADIPEARGALLKRQDIKKIIERLAPQTKQLLQKNSLTIQETNKLRQLVDKTLGDRAFLGGQLSSDKIILKKFADTLRETVKSKAPAGTRELFSEISNEIRFRDGLLDRIAKRAGNQVLTFGDFIGGGLGGVFGGGFGGAVAGVAARRALESVPFKIGSAKVITAITKAEPVFESMTSVQQTAIMKLFAEIFSPSSKSPSNSFTQPNKRNY